MDLSVVIAGLALIVSLASLWQNFKSQHTQEKLTDREVELVRHQLGAALREERASKRANVSARLHKVGKHDWRLRVFDAGPVTAKQVHVLQVQKENSMFPERSLAQKLPMSQMEKGDYVDINAFVHMRSAFKEIITLVWDDLSGTGNRKDVEVTL